MNINWKNIVKKSCVSIVTACFCLMTIMPSGLSAQSIMMPSMSTSVGVQSIYHAPMLKGMVVNPLNPFEFDFIMDSGNLYEDDSLLREESKRLINYFLASLAMPEEELWVNLSPYEQDRIIPDSLSVTELGRDLLTQDYILKQLSSSLTNPEKELGKVFWDRVLKKVEAQFNTTDVPLNLFSKVWIIPNTAKIYEHQNKTFVTESHLSVLTEEDYLAFRANITDNQNVHEPDASKAQDVTKISTQIMKEIIIPEIEREVNYGESFTKLRQIYHSFILAVWYKDKLRETILGAQYVDQRKTQGIEIEDRNIKEEVYENYLKAFKDGAYNYIKEDYDPKEQRVIPRKYFSGGAKLYRGEDSYERVVDSAQIPDGNYVRVAGDFAMVSEESSEEEEAIDEFVQQFYNPPHLYDSYLGLRRVHESSVRGKVVLVRPDHNVGTVEQEDGSKTLDNTQRVDVTAPMFSDLQRKGAKIVVAAHVSDPYGEVKSILTERESSFKRRIAILEQRISRSYGKPEQRMRYDSSLRQTRVNYAYFKKNRSLIAQELLAKKKEEFSTKPHAQVLENAINQYNEENGISNRVKVIHVKATKAREVKDLLENLKEDEILYLENVRNDRREMIMHNAKGLLKKKVKTLQKSAPASIKTRKIGVESLQTAVQRIINSVLDNYFLEEEDLKKAQNSLMNLLNLMYPEIRSVLLELKTQVFEKKDDFWQAVVEKSGETHKEVVNWFGDIYLEIEHLYKPLNDFNALKAEFYDGVDYFVFAGASVMHREHASTVGQKGIPTLMADIVTDELRGMDRILEQERIVGFFGGKSGKTYRDKQMLFLEPMASNPGIKKIPLGGGLGLVAHKYLGSASVAATNLKIEDLREQDGYIQHMGSLLENPRYKDKFVLPRDWIIGKNLNNPKTAEVRVILADQPLPPGFRIIDIGSRTMVDYVKITREYPTAFFNSMMGEARRDRKGRLDNVVGDDLLNIIFQGGLTAQERLQFQAFAEKGISTEITDELLRGVPADDIDILVDLLFKGDAPVSREDVNKTILRGELGTQIVFRALARMEKSGGVGGGTIERLEKWMLDPYVEIYPGGGSNLSYAGGRIQPALAAAVQNNGNIPRGFYDYEKYFGLIKQRGFLAKGMFAVIVQDALIRLIDELMDHMAELSTIFGDQMPSNEIAEKMKSLEDVRKDLQELGKKVPLGQPYFMEKDLQAAEDTLNAVRDVLLKEGEGDFISILDRASIFRYKVIVPDEQNEKVNHLTTQISWLKNTMESLVRQLALIDAEHHIEGDISQSILDYNVDLNVLMQEAVQEMKSKGDNISRALKQEGLVEIIWELQENLPNIITIRDEYKKRVKALIRNAVYAVAIEDPRAGRWILRPGIDTQKGRILIRTAVQETPDGRKKIELDISNNGIEISEEESREMLRWWKTAIQADGNGNGNGHDDTTLQGHFGKERGVGVPFYLGMVRQMNGSFIVNPKGAKTDYITTIRTVFPQHIIVSESPYAEELEKLSYESPAIGAGASSQNRFGSTADSANLSDQKKGGIDLHSDYLNIEKQGEGIQFDLPDSFDQSISEIPGLIPNINTISPIINLPQLLGLNYQDKKITDISYNKNLSR